jgi:secreted trypsin-like serine protease
MSKRLALLMVLLLMASLASPAGAITNGELDGNGHPGVVLIVMDVNYQPAYRCSGTLVAPTFVLTAGHCAGAPGEFTGMRVFTESDVEHGNNTYPYAGGPNSVEAIRWAAHPDYPTASFVVHDVGMIELATPISLDAKDFGRLPTPNQLDSLKTKRGAQGQTFTAVGYGVQRIHPVFEISEKIRMVAYPRLIQINVPGFTGDFSMLLSNNHSTGGTCFGDSGGPNFLGTSLVVAGVTSFGLNGNCAGTGGVFRIDRPGVLAFINDFMAG